MAYEPNPQGRHPALHFPAWHDGPECVVNLVPGPTEVWIWCATCRCAVALNAISTRILLEGSGAAA